MSSIKVRHDLRDRFGAARDQGGRETCLAFAMSDAHAAAIGGEWTPLSCEYLFYHAKTRDKTPAQSGTTPSAAMAALEHDGQPVEADWPYLHALPKNLAEWKPPAKTGSLFRRKSTTNGAAFTQIWDAVEYGQPMLIGMALSAAFFAPETDGVIDSLETPEPAMKHAVLAVATGMSQGTKLVLVRNSWGSGWGLSGYGWLSERYLDPRVFIAIAVN